MLRSRPIGPRHAAVATLAVLLALAGLLAASPQSPGGEPSPGETPSPEGSSSADRPPNVLLVTLDTLRADRVGCYGYAPASTPNLDALASRGVRFERAVVQVPLTVPSHASIHTGTYPIFHGSRNNANYPLTDANVTLAERLSDAGYATEAIVASKVLFRNFGLDQGFDHYDDDVRAEEHGPRGAKYRTGGHVTRLALERAKRLPDDRPYFLWVHYYDPHAPWVAPEPFASQHDQPYDAEVAHVDACLGELLEGMRSLGKMDDTLLVVTSDHGEGLEDPHAELTHGIFLYEETLHVPLLIAGDGIRPAVVPGLVRSIDLLPTILDRVGLSIHENVQGVSLAAALDGGARPEIQQSYFDTLMPREAYGWSALYGFRTGDWKYIRAPRPELYDLRSDPREQRNLALDQPDRLERMEAELRRIESTYGREGADRPQRGEIDAELKRQLVALGYVHADSPELTEDPTKDPKDLIGVQKHVNTAMGLHEQNRIPEALGELAKAAALDPTNIEVLKQQGTLYLETGRLDEAQERFESLLSRYEGDVMANFRLGQVHRDRAKAMAAGGNEDAAYDEREKAADAYGRAIALNPRHALSLLDLANISVRQGSAEDALPLYRRAYESNPRLLEARINRAAVLRRLDRFDEALTEVESIEAEFTSQEIGRLGAGTVLASIREAATARKPASDGASGGGGLPSWGIGLILAAILLISAVAIRIFRKS